MKNRALLSACMRALLSLLRTHAHSVSMSIMFTFVRMRGCVNLKICRDDDGRFSMDRKYAGRDPSNTHVLHITNS